MEDDFFRSPNSSSKQELSFAQTVMDPADRRQFQPRVVYNDGDVQIFRRCLAHYMSNDYQSAISEIRQLRARYIDVVHIHLNELIISFYMGRCCAVDDFLADMKEAMTRAYGQSFENGKVRDLTQVGYLYNYALILFYLAKYNQSLHVAQIVTRYFETLEDGLVRDCCFLLLELYLIHYQMPEAMSIIGYLEEEFDEATGLRINLPETFRQDTLLFDENSQLFRPISGFKAKLQLYKVKVVNTFRLEALSKKESKGLLTTHGITNPLPVYLKSQSEFNRGNNSKAVKLLNHLAPTPTTPASIVNGDILTSLFYNNLACIHSAMGKSTMAAVYFNKALEENTKAMQTLSFTPQSPSTTTLSYNQIPLLCIAASRIPELIYNLGTQLLISGQPSQAFPLLIEASHSYHQNPRLWLRLAECCIAKHKNDVIDPLHRRKPTRYMIKGHVGVGKYRKLLLSPVLLPYQKQLSQKVQPTNELKKDPSEPALSHEFARMCLINALAAVNRHISRGSSHSGSSKFMEDMQPIVPSGVASKQEFLILKAYILVNLAFVSNALWDFVGGIDYAKQAENISGVPGVISFLVCAYASEGLIRMNRLPDAGQYLSVAYVNNVFRQMNEDLEKAGQVNMVRHTANLANSQPNTPGSMSSRSSVDMNSNSLDEQANLYDQPGAAIKSFLHVPNDYLRKRPLYARNLLVYNHAVWLSLSGDLNASYIIAEKLKNTATNSDAITRARATQLCIYIRFRQGRRKDATRLIMEECPEWKDRLARDFDDDEKKLRTFREQQGIAWPLE